MSFDVVTLVGPNDVAVWRKQVQYTKQNVVGFRRIFIIGSPACLEDARIHGKEDDIEIIDEKTFPFSIGDVRTIFHPYSRILPWYFQQMLKLYAGEVIPGILDKYLVIDSDTFFLRPTAFLDPDGKFIFTVSFKESNATYYDHMHRLHPSLVHPRRETAIVHHMMFDRALLRELFSLVEDKGPFWKVFFETVSVDQRDHSGASEYELYYCFMLRYHPESIRTRFLNYENGGNVNSLESLRHENVLDFVSCHWYCR